MSFKVNKITQTYVKLTPDEITDQVKNTKICLNRYGKIIVDTSDYKIFAKEEDAIDYILSELKEQLNTYNNKILYFRKLIEINESKIKHYEETVRPGVRLPPKI